MSRFAAQPTPNPNSLKFTRSDGERFLETGMLSCTRIEQAAEHPLAAAIFSVPGVAGFFALPDFITVTREAGASWNTLVPAVEEALEAYFPA